VKFKEAYELNKLFMIHYHLLSTKTILISLLLLTIKVQSWQNITHSSQYCAQQIGLAAIVL